MYETACLTFYIVVPLFKRPTDGLAYNFNCWKRFHIHKVRRVNVDALKMAIQLKLIYRKPVRRTI